MRLLALLSMTAAACSSGNDAAPVELAYPDSHLLLRVGQPVEPQVPIWTGPASANFAVAPPLPAGLQLDSATGSVSGTPAAQQSETAHTVTAGDALTELRIAVGPALPAAFRSLQAGYTATTVVESARMPAKLAPAPDGRVFYTELMTGQIRVIDPQGQLLPAPFFTLPVLGGGHLGLLGIALAPDFAQSGELFVLACTPADAGHGDRSRLLSLIAQGDVGTDLRVVLDDLPVAALNNGGALAFDATGHLLVSIGDTLDPARAQDDGSPAGKILRVRRDGGIPADNPDPSSYVYCKGLRNTWALTVHPLTGGVFGADNGPDSDDELNFLQPGKNFEWGGTGGFGAATGYRMHHWPDVVVPTGLCFHDSGVLLATLYDPEQIVGFRLSGAQRTDVDELFGFAEFLPRGNDRKPVDIAAGPDGSLWVATFDAIHRVQRHGSQGPVSP